ncbi:hypothetical protein ABIB45_004431 [Arthrobacter sp. UYCo732]
MDSGLGPIGTFFYGFLMRLMRLMRLMCLMCLSGAVACTT